MPEEITAFFEESAAGPGGTVLQESLERSLSLQDDSGVCPVLRSAHPQRLTRSAWGLLFADWDPNASLVSDLVLAIVLEPAPSTLG